jgi:hypothetical protein
VPDLILSGQLTHSRLFTAVSSHQMEAVSINSVDFFAHVAIAIGINFGIL